MKKLIFVLFTITMITLSFLSIKQYEYIQFQEFNNLVEDEKWNVIINKENVEKSNDENYRLLQQIAIETNINFQRISYENNKIVYYVALADDGSYFDNINLRSGRYLNNQSNVNDFLSTEDTKDKSQIGMIEIFHSFEPIEIRPIIAAKKVRDVKGTYVTNSKINAERIKETALEKGLIVEISKEQSEYGLTEYPYQSMIYKASFVLFLLITLSILYDVVNNYKEISVRYLFGYKSIEVSMHLIKKYILLFVNSMILSFLGLIIFLYFYNGCQQLISFIIFSVKNYLMLIFAILIIFGIAMITTKFISIPQMIKNKKPIKILFYVNYVVRLILAVFLICGLVQQISTYLIAKNINDKKEKWEILKEYSYLGISSSEEIAKLGPMNPKKNMQLKKMYEDLELQGAFYISPSNYYLEDSNVNKNIKPWEYNGERVEINKNYLLVNKIVDVSGKAVNVNEKNSNNLTVIVPEKYKKYKNNIAESISNDYMGVYNELDSTLPKVDLIYVKNNQKYFSFSPNFAESNDYEIIDPIAVVINSDFDSRLLAPSMSMGYGFYTKNISEDNPLEGVQTTLEKYGFNNTWQPVSVAYSLIENKIETNNALLILVSIYCGLFVILAVILLFFSAIYYIEINKRVLAIQKIFGYSFIEKHYYMYVINMIFWNIVFAVTFLVTNKYWLLFKIIILFITLDIALLSIIISLKEFKVIKKLLIEV